MKPILASLSFVVLAICMSGCPHLPPPSGCAPRSSKCENDRPFVCSGSQRWTQVGDTTCADVGGVCCMTSDGVHACVQQSACVGEGQ